MATKSKTVALERRGDLTSLFRMIGMYGPAVALAIIAMLGVWAVFIIYRTVRGRRKMSGDNMLLMQKDAVNPPEATPKEDEIASCEDSTEDSDEGLAEMLGSKSEGPTEDLSRTNDNSDLSAEESDADWLAIEECHPGSPPEHYCEASEQCSHDHAEQEEPASHCFLSGEMDENGHLIGMETHSQTAQRLVEVELSDEWHREGEEPDSNHPHAFDEDPHEESEHPGDENLPEVAPLGDADLEEPQPDRAPDKQEVKIHTHEATNEKTFEIDAGEIVNDLATAFPQADAEHSACVGYVELYGVSDECVHDPIANRQAENWPEAMIGLRGPLVDQSQEEEEEEEEECPEEDDGQDSLHYSAIDQLDEQVEDGGRYLIDRPNEPVEVNDGGLIDLSGEVIFDAGITGLNDEPREPSDARDGGGIDTRSDRSEAPVTGITDRFMEPSEVGRPVAISETKGERVDENADADAEEEVYEKTEISIMEAIMDDNEWMTAGAADGHGGDLPWLPSSADREGERRPEGEPRDLEDAAVAGEQGNEAVAATEDARPLPQTVHVSFRVHYLTPSPRQVLAVTGDQQVLGSWTGFVPLAASQDGFWASSVGLPAGSRVEWKFVLVEEGRIRRWEECANRRLETGHGADLQLHEWWGFL